MIKISRKEQLVLKALKNVMAAEQLEAFTEEMYGNIDPDDSCVQSLLGKNIIVFNSELNGYTITKEQLQVEDDDPEVEQAWEDFRAVQGDGSMTKLYDRNKKAEKATKHLEQVLFEKGRLTHMVDKDHGHIWVTEDKVDYWKNRGWKEACPKAVPIGLQA